MRLVLLAACAALFAYAGSASLAQEMPAGRYQMEKTEDGLVRLDTRTGEMSICHQRAGEIVCEAAHDRSGAADEQIRDLEQRIGALERRISALEAENGAKPEMPSDAELDQAFDMMERFVQRFSDLFRDLDRENDKPVPPAAPMPDRT